MSIHPQEIAVLLNLCPICPDIQYKILMLILGINGTPTSNLFKAPKIFTFYTETFNKKKIIYYWKKFFFGLSTKKNKFLKFFFF